MLLLDLIQNGIVLGLLYGLFAYGISMIVTAVGIWHFAHGLTFAVGCYVFWLTFEPTVAGWVVSVIATVAATAGVGVAMERLVYAPLIRRGADHLMHFVATLSMLALGQSLISITWGSAARSVSIPAFFSQSFTVGGIRVSNWDILVVALAVVAVIVLSWLQDRTRFGLAFRAMGDNADRASTFGIKLSRVQIGIFIVASISVVPVSVLVSLQTPIYPTMGFTIMIKGVIALLIGGKGNLVGLMLGGIVVGLIEAVPQVWIPSAWSPLVLFAVLLAFLLVKPAGMSRVTRTT